MYEGNTLPACRINHTGGRSVFSPLSVFSSIEFVVNWYVFKIYLNALSSAAVARTFSFFTFWRLRSTVILRSLFYFTSRSAPVSYGAGFLLWSRPSGIHLAAWPAWTWGRHLPASVNGSFASGFIPTSGFYFVLLIGWTWPATVSIFNPDFPWLGLALSRLYFRSGAPGLIHGSGLFCSSGSGFPCRHIHVLPGSCTPWTGLYIGGRTSCLVDFSRLLSPAGIIPPVVLVVLRILPFWTYISLSAGRCLRSSSFQFILIGDTGIAFGERSVGIPGGIIASSYTFITVLWEVNVSLRGTMIRVMNIDMMMHMPVISMSGIRPVIAVPPWIITPVVWWIVRPVMGAPEEGENNRRVHIHRFYNIVRSVYIGITHYLNA